MNSLKQSFKAFLLRVPLKEQVIFARHLAVMARSGMPLLDSLLLIKKQSRSKSMKKILEQVTIEVSNGQFLSASLEQFRRVFGDLFVDIIRVGEASGTLSENLNYLADELKKKQELRGKVIGAMVYPVIVLTATLGITGLLTIFIFPKIMPVFQSLNVDLPITTKILIAVSNILTNYGGWVVSAAFMLLVILWALLRVEKIRYYYDAVLLHSPIIGSVVHAVNLSNFCRTLGLTLKSGVQVVQAIEITTSTLSNLVYRKELSVIGVDLAKGEAISKHLSKHSNVFPPLLAQMVEVGENTGNLSDTFLYLAEFYEGELNEFTKNMSTILEPILMVTMGIIVGFVAISIITPIYEVTQRFGR